MTLNSNHTLVLSPYLTIQINGPVLANIGPKFWVKPSATVEHAFEFELTRLKDINETPEVTKNWVKNVAEPVVLSLLENRFSPNQIKLTQISDRFTYASDAIMIKGKAKIDPAQARIANLIDYFGNKDSNVISTWLELNGSVYESNHLFSTKLEASHLLEVRRFSFGCLVEMNKYAMHFEPEFGQHVGLVKSSSASFEHDKKQLLLKMHVKGYRNSRGGPNTEKYQFTLNYSSIRGFILSRDQGQWSLFINLIWPPLLYKINRAWNKNRNSGGGDRRSSGGDGRSSGDFNADILNDSQNGTKDVEFQETVLIERVNLMPQMRSPADYGRCHILKLAFNQDTDDPEQFKSLINLLINVQRFSGKSIPIHFAGISLAHARGHVHRNAENWYKDYVEDELLYLPFNVLYALHCIWTLNYKLIDEFEYHEVMLGDEDYATRFCKELDRRARSHPKAAEQALVDLFHAIDSGEHIHIVNTFETSFNKRVKQKVKHNLVDDNDKKYCYIRRAIHTPSRTIFLPPMIYLKSRFLRTYDPECSIRILLRDDNLMPVSFTVRGKKEQQDAFYQAYIVDQISAGIDIFGRKFDYLGNSTSQLRDNGFFMYARPEPTGPGEYRKGFSAADIRRQIGDLHVIKNPAKYVARLGQAFSQPMGTVDNVTQDLVTCVPDIKVTNLKTMVTYNFSDGIGRISPDLANELANSLPHPYKDIPSAYQIRYAGYKGMLTIDPLLTGTRTIVFRDSMNKFKSQSVSIEVIKPSQPRYAYLNKPFINILNQKGISTAVFVRLQLDALKKVTEGFLCSCKGAILLKTMCGSLKISFDGLCHAGINILDEPFFRGIVDAVSRKTIREMKEKARIPLPLDTCRNLMGVLDETRALQYGQVFIQYTHSESGAKIVHVGKVLVTKFPGIHPVRIRNLVN